VTNGNGIAGVWKVLALVLASVVITGLGAWIGFAKDAPDRAEVCQMIETGATQEPEVRRIVQESSPYVRDEGVIKKSIGDLEAKVGALDSTVDGLRTEQTKLVERIDNVLKALPHR
jgi:hypothetical protein